MILAVSVSIQAWHPDLVGVASGIRNRQSQGSPSILQGGVGEACGLFLTRPVSMLILPRQRPALQSIGAFSLALQPYWSRQQRAQPGRHQENGIGTEQATATRCKSARIRLTRRSHKSGGAVPSRCWACGYLLTRADKFPGSSFRWGRGSRWLTLGVGLKGADGGHPITIA